MLLSVALLAASGLAQTPAKPPAAPSTAKPSTAKPAASKPAASKPATPPVPDRPDGVYATFTIVQGNEPMGTIVAKLYEKEMPITVGNFIALARGTKPWRDPKTKQVIRKPLYNGLTFHRVIPGFMIQGGDPTGTGMGGTEVIKDEYNPALKFDKPGLLAMANAGPNTGSCQFFITERPTLPHLDGKHPIFGEVIEGQDVVEKIARVPRGENDKPNVPVIMKTVRIDRYPRTAPASKPSPAKTTPSKPAAPAPAKK